MPKAQRPLSPAALSVAESYYPTLQKTINAYRRMHHRIGEELHDELTTRFLTCCNSWDPARGTFYGHWRAHVRGAVKTVAKRLEGRSRAEPLWEGLPAPSDPPDDDLSPRVLAALESLPPAMARAVDLAWLGGRTSIEAAWVLGVAWQAVDQHLAGARKRLKAILADNDAADAG